MPTSQFTVVKRGGEKSFNAVRGGGTTIVRSEGAFVASRSGGNFTVKKQASAFTVQVSGSGTTVSRPQSVVIRVQAGGLTPPAAATDHAVLTNLEWTVSAHTGSGTVSNLAGFDAAGAAVLYTLTGTGTVIVAQTSPTIITPTIASFANATHNHADAAGGGQLDHGLALTGLSDDDHTIYVLASGARAFSGDQSMGGNQLTDVGAPAASTDAATKGYVDALVNNLDWKASVRVATTAAGTLATDFEDGDTLDGLTLATGDRILLKNQADGAENGIYTVEATGAPTRAEDADSSAEVTAGMLVHVSEGTANADTFWVLTTNDPITLDTTALVFAQFGVGGVTDHTGLSNLVWADSDHTGTVSTFAGFDGAGAAAYYTEANYLLAAGTRPLTAAWDAGSWQIRAETFQSDVATGTAPFVVASTTVVANLNADLLDGQQGSYYLDSANFTGTNWTDLTDAGATTLHKHDHGGMDGLADDDHTIYLLADGTRALTAAWDAGSFEIRAETFQSDVATGTAPLIVASTTVVTNLNADLLDGQHAAAFAAVSHTHDAAVITYTPAVATDWDGDADPGNVDDALDQLAERVDDLEGAGGSSDHATLSNLSWMTSGHTGSVGSIRIAGFDPDGFTQLLAMVGTGDLVGSVSPTITTPTIAKLANLTSNGFVKTSGGDGTLSVDTTDYAQLGHDHPASIITYTPAVATDWDGDADPGNVDDALDQLAERVDDLEGGGAGTFLGLTDTPSAYTGQAGKVAAVNSGETGIEFISVGGAGVPTGTLLPFAGSSAPSGYLLCFGQAVDRTTYADLFAVISTTYGVGDGSTTFNLPDARGRALFGKDDMGGSGVNRITAAGSGITGTTLGASGGAQVHTLTTAQLPTGIKAIHEINNHPGGGGGNALRNNGGGTLYSAGGGGAAHNNMPPALIANLMIKT